MTCHVSTKWTFDYRLLTRYWRSVVNKRRWFLASSPVWGTLVVCGLAWAGTPAWSPDRVAAAFLAADVNIPIVAKDLTNGGTVVIDTGRWSDAKCVSVSRVKFRCSAVLTIPEQWKVPARVPVWVRVREVGEGSVCVSPSPSVPAGCWSAADGVRGDAPGSDAFRRWRSGGGILDQGGSSCWYYGSSFYRCVDVPVGNEDFKPVWATVVVHPSGATVKRIS